MPTIDHTFTLVRCYPTFIHSLLYQGQFLTYKPAHIWDGPEETCVVTWFLHSDSNRVQGWTHFSGAEKLHHCAAPCTGLLHLKWCCKEHELWTGAGQWCHQPFNFFLSSFNTEAYPKMYLRDLGLWQRVKDNFKENLQGVRGRKLDVYVNIISDLATFKRWE